MQISGMAKTYRPYFPEQDFLLPPSPKDWLPEDHLAYFVADVVDQLGLSAIGSVYEKEERGQPPYHPRMMTKILVYAYCVGVFSSRRKDDARYLEKIYVEECEALHAPAPPLRRTLSTRASNRTLIQHARRR
jgi:hypothetical protein